MQLLQADDPVAIGGHRLTGRLRFNGTAVVYLARDAAAGLVAVKTTHAETAEEPQVRDRLRREAACARRLPSFCTARLLHDGTDQTPPYLVSAHIEGPSLEHVVDAGGPLAPELVRTLATELARALAAVHDADVIHGNLMPANIILTKHGLGVIDFGVAQEISTSGAEIGAAADNPGWLAPELLTGGPPGSACDVFGWGCLVGYAATGHGPYDENVPGPPDLRQLIQASLAEDPADRPTATDLMARLDAPATDPPPETHHVPKHRAEPAAGNVWRPRRTRAFAAMSALAGVLLIAVPSRTQVDPAPPSALGPTHSPHPSRPAPGPPNTSAITALGEPPAARRRPRSPQRAESPSRDLQISCTGVPSRWCPKAAAEAINDWERSSGWRMSWTSPR